MFFYLLITLIISPVFPTFNTNSYPSFFPTYANSNFCLPYFIFFFHHTICFSYPFPLCICSYTLFTNSEFTHCFVALSLTIISTPRSHRFYWTNSHLWSYYIFRLLSPPVPDHFLINPTFFPIFSLFCLLTDLQYTLFSLFLLLPFSVILRLPSLFSFLHPSSCSLFNPPSPLSF